MSENLRPARAVAPGRILERELEARGWSQRDLAAIMNRPPQAISEIVRGAKQITPDTAIALAQALGTSAELWTTLEANYRLRLVSHDRSDDDDIQRRSRLFSIAPVGELLRRGWIKASTAIADLEREVCAFLGIESPAETPQLRAQFRQSAEHDPELPAQIAWVRRIELLAGQQEIGPFDRMHLLEAMPTIRALAARSEGIAEVPPLLHELGVRFTIVPHLPKTYIDGAACGDALQPIVALTLRYDRIDAAWFTLMHELAHVALGHPGLYIDNHEDAALNQEQAEIEANRQASDWLLPPAAFAAFLARLPRYVSRDHIVRFAAEQRVHPGIVLGRLQREGRVPYRNMRDLLVNVTPYLAGWIDTPHP